MRAAIEPSARTQAMPCCSRETDRISSSRPMRSATVRAAPRRSTACPPGRGAGARSTTVTAMPLRVSQDARAGPAMPAPEISTLRVIMTLSVWCTQRTAQGPEADSVLVHWAARHCSVLVHEEGPMTEVAPASARIAGELRRRITSGELAPGARVPSTRAIVQRYGVAMATATKVLAALQHEGLIRTVPGVGSVVAGAPPAEKPERRRTSSPEGALGVSAIVAAGIAVADAEGLVALSMRRVAAELGAAPMSLYRHVRDKDQLLLQMMDAAISEVALPEPPANWREGLEIAARALWTGFRRHPWLPPALSLTRPQLLPGALE